jgi:sialidase-1
MKFSAVHIFILALFPMLSIYAAEPVFSDVFVALTDGFKSIRIPSVIVTKKGTLLAFAEARAANSDQAQNKIALKRSSDNGQTWSAITLIADDGANSLNNPVAIVERETGKVLLMYQRIPGHLKEHSKEVEIGFEGPNVYRNFLITSDDDGATWSKPLDITSMTKRATGATTLAGGPGIAIQLEHGPNKGRILFPFNDGPYGMWNNYVVFSDDRGVTWKCGENVPGALVANAKGAKKSQINEVQVAELSDGSVLLNSRQFAGAKVRKKSISHDGGVTWSTIEDVPELRDPSCMGSILRYSFAENGAKNILLYSGPDSLKRENGTVYASIDDGATWPIKRVLRKDDFAYSVLTRLPNGDVGCLFEANNYARIVFARFPLDWVLDGTEK